MLNRTIFSSITVILLLVFPLLSFAEYKVVIKKNGKIIEGKLLAEDETSITIVTRGAQLKYKKDTLDLERMKELNAEYQSKSDVKKLDRPAPDIYKKQQTQTSSGIADVAKQNRDARSETKKSGSDSNEKALMDWVAELEQKNQVVPSQGTQIELSKAKKALSHYGARDSRELSNNDRKLMLDQLVKALDSVYRKQLEAGASDETTAALKKKIEDTKAQLSKLE